MSWLVILIVIFPDGSVIEQPWATTHDERICIIAGAGSVDILTRANPGTLFAYRCDQVEPPTS